MAQIKIGNDLVKPKAINVFQGGVWREQKTGYIYLNNEWISFIDYMDWVYKEGSEYVDIVEGSTKGSATYRSFQKKQDHLFLSAQGYMTSIINESQSSWVTNEPIDLTDVNMVYFDFEALSRISQQQFVLLAVSRIKSGSSSDVGRRFTADINRRIEGLNVASLSGDFYIRGLVNSISPGTATELKVFNIWLD